MSASTVLTWNVAGRVGGIQRAQMRALAGRPFDVLCLQEVTPTTREPWAEWLLTVLDDRTLEVTRCTRRSARRPDK